MKKTATAILPPSRRPDAGFTLVEVVIALAILAFALFGMISVITYSARSNAATRERMLAMRAAERKIEQMLSCATFDDIFLKFSVQVEGQGWDQVEGLIPVQPVPDPTVSNFPYPAPDPKAVLFVRFPCLNNGGLNFTEANSGILTQNYPELAGKPNMASPIDLDLNRKNGTTDTSIPIADMKLLPVLIEVYWRGTIGPKSGNIGNTYLRYRYTFLRKT